MKKLDPEKLIIYCVSILVVAVSAPFIRKVPRSQGKNPLFHGIFLAAAVAVLVFVPGFVQDEIFSPGSVMVVGTLIPIYESISAACSFGEASSRDVAMLQYWIAASLLNFGTEFIDDMKHHFPHGGEHWFEFELIFTIWLMSKFVIKYLIVLLFYSICILYLRHDLRVVFVDNLFPFLNLNLHCIVYQLQIHWQTAQLCFTTL